MREIRTSGSEGGEAGTNRPSLPLSPWRLESGQQATGDRAGEKAKAVESLSLRHRLL